VKEEDEVNFIVHRECEPQKLKGHCVLMSASLQMAAGSLVREWQMVTVAFLLVRWQCISDSQCNARARWAT
jgi:hypothetical protein